MSAPADCVGRLEAAGRHEPGGWIGGHAVARPLLERRLESIVQRFLGEIEVTKQTNKVAKTRRESGAINGIHYITRVHHARLQLQ